MRRIGTLLITIFVELRVVAGRSRTWQVAHRPSLVGRAVPWPWEERHGQTMAWARHGHGMGMASVSQTRSHCVNQMGKTHSKPLAARYGREWYGRGMGHGMLYVWICLWTYLCVPSHEFIRTISYQQFICIYCILGRNDLVQQFKISDGCNSHSLFQLHDVIN